MYCETHDRSTRALRQRRSAFALPDPRCDLIRTKNFHQVGIQGHGNVVIIFRRLDVGREIDRTGREDPATQARNISISVLPLMR